MTLRIGVDVGGTKILGVALDDLGREVARVRRPTGWGLDAVADGIAAVVGELRGVAGGGAAHGLLGEPVAAVGVGIPGQIRPGIGIVEHALNLGIERGDLAAAVAARTGIRPVVDNDVRCAAVGARSLLPGLDTLAYVNLGTGIAAAIVGADGPWRGAHGAAGEIGHVSIDPAGPRCRCGQRGCIEAFAGGGAVAARWGATDDLPVRAVFDTADAGDARALELRRDLVRAVAAAAQLLVLTADVDAVVVGGGVAALGERLLAPVRTALASASAASPFLRSLRLDDRIVPVPAGVAVGALGAALTAPAPAPA